MKTQIDVATLVAELPLLIPAVRVAELLSIDARTVRRWIASQRIRALKMSRHRAGRVLIPKTEIVRLLTEMCR